MNTTPRVPPARSGPPAWVWVVLVLCVLTAVNMGFAAGDPLLELSETSYGKSSTGFGAVHDLLSELPAQPRSERSLASYAELPRARTLWLLAPDLLVLRDEDTERRIDDGQEQLASELQRFVERGGIVLLFGSTYSDWSRYGLELAASRDPGKRLLVPSALAPHPRAIDVPALRHFAPEQLGGFERVAGTAAEPFVVEKKLGAGRLIAIADVTPLQNQHLDRADHALLAADLARAYGWPLLDERCHGLLPDVSLASALGWPRSALLVAALGLCALLALWHLRSVPAATLVHEAGLDPGLGSFVDSLAVLYARKAPRDAAAVYRAYLHGVRFRLRQQLYGARGGSDEQLSPRLQRELSAEPELLAALQGKREPRDERALRDCARELERSIAVLAARHAARSHASANRA